MKVNHRDFKEFSATVILASYADHEMKLFCVSLSQQTSVCIPDAVFCPGFQKGRVKVKVKVKVCFYIAQYPVHWTAQSALHFLPSLADLFIPTPFSASPGSILARQQLRAKTKSLTLPSLSIARYSFAI